MYNSEDEWFVWFLRLAIIIFIAIIFIMVANVKKAEPGYIINNGNVTVVWSRGV